MEAGHCGTQEAKAGGYEFPVSRLHRESLVSKKKKKKKHGLT
jgi:hypothetical protein